MTTAIYSFQRFLYTLELFQKKAVWFLGVSIVVCLMSYGFFIVSTILNVVEREQILAETARLGGFVSSLESEYNNTASRITIDFAKTLGFQEIKNIQYVTQTGLAISI